MIESPVNGERITWIETSQSTRGELLAFELQLRPGAAVAAEHRHIRQEEVFTVLSGAVGREVEGEKRTAGPGQQVTGPIGAAHRWWNGGHDEARVRIGLRPALDTETFFETFFGLARDGKTNAKGIPGLLQIAVAFRDLGDSCPQLVKPPPVVQRVVFESSASLNPRGVQQRARSANFVSQSSVVVGRDLWKRARRTEVAGGQPIPIHRR